MKDRATFRCLLVILSAALTTLLSQPAHARCTEKNLLARAELIAHEGIPRPELLNDGWSTPEGSPFNAREATPIGAQASATWDLGRQTKLRAADIRADHNDQYNVLISNDNKEWRLFWKALPVEETGLRVRTGSGMEASGRYLRLVAQGGDGVYSVSELRVFCQRPEQWPPPILTSLTLNENLESTATYQAFTGKLALALLGLFLIFVVAPRIPTRWARVVLMSVIGFSALGWIHFGQFQGKTVVHHWDMFHYYMGSKYYEELGYFDLYRCVAKYEQEQGHAENYDGVLMRNLEDNRLYPFSWSATRAGRCRGHFSDKSWREFGEDIEAFRPEMSSPPFEHVVGDHGFNATPFHATWLGAITKHTSASPTTLRVLAQMDSLALICAMAAVAWGFGLPAAAVTALMLQVAAPWSYNWVGGGLGRHTWFALSCLGLALLAKKKEAGGAAALTGAVLLRFFPLVFLGGLGVHFIFECVRARRLTEQARRALIGVLLTVSIATMVVVAAHGNQPLRNFVEVVTEHADAPAANRMGFPHLLTIGPGKDSSSWMNPELTDPSQPWKEMLRVTLKERKPLWFLALAASLGILFWVVWTIRSPWVSVAAAAPLLYSLQAMTSYDYIWLLLLIPLGFRRKRALVALCGFAIWTQVIGVVQPDLELRHWLYAVVLFFTMTVVSYELCLWGSEV